MRPTRKTAQCLSSSCVLLALALGATSVKAQVQEVLVGITIACPYENAIEGSCWSGAYWALMKLEGVKTVDKTANGYNCTARVYLNDKSFPDPDQWASQFKKLVDQTYTFRGVEVTVDGTVGGDNNGLVVRVPGVKLPITLRPLEHKLQWNSKKGTARQPEPDERDAYQQLGSKVKESKANDFKTRVTGTLRKSGTGYTLEVREFFPLTQ
jgi:galactose oxidase